MRTFWNRRFLGGPLWAMPNPGAILTPIHVPTTGAEVLPTIRMLWNSTSEEYSRKIPSLPRFQNVRFLNEDLAGTGKDPRKVFQISNPSLTLYATSPSKD